MLYLTVRSEFLKELLGYEEANIVEYILCDLKEIGKIISFRIRLNYDLELDQLEQTKFLITKKVRELQERRNFSRHNIRKQSFKNKSIKEYVFIIY